jgi:nucleosome-remodeling factor subunit BPTF
MQSKRSKTISGENCPACDRIADVRRFSICCARCTRRFHGKCVGLTERRAKKQESAWQCPDCIKSNSLPEDELFCVCKRPYNSRLFYVGCDGCENWFHPECVGTTRA